MEKTAQQLVSTGRAEREPAVMDRSTRPDQCLQWRTRSGQTADSPQLKADVAKALFEIERLEAIVEDLAVVVAHIGRATGGIGEVEDRLDHLERTFGTRSE